MCPPQSCEGHERGCHPVFDAGSQPPAPCLAGLEGALSPLLGPPHLLSHQTFDLVTRHNLVVLFDVLQRLLDPRLVLPSQSVPLGLSQEEVQGHIRGLLGLRDIDLGSARSPCVHTALGQRAQPVQQSPITRAAPRVTSGGWLSTCALDRDSGCEGGGEILISAKRCHGSPSRETAASHAHP